MKRRNMDSHVTLHGIDGGKKSVRYVYEQYRGETDIDVPVITVLSADDVEYAATIARLVRDA